MMLTGPSVVTCRSTLQSRWGVLHIDGHAGEVGEGEVEAIDGELQDLVTPGAVGAEVRQRKGRLPPVSGWYTRRYTAQATLRSRSVETQTGVRLLVLPSIDLRHRAAPPSARPNARQLPFGAFEERAGKQRRRRSGAAVRVTIHRCRSAGTGRTLQWAGCRGAGRHSGQGACLSGGGLMGCCELWRGSAVHWVSDFGSGKRPSLTCPAGHGQSISESW
jgi:hypothetical protein